MARSRKPRASDAITLRNLPEPVARVVREHAVRYGVSLNRAVIGLLEEATGARAPRPREHHDMDHLFGTLSVEGADAMERSAADSRVVLPEEWE